MTIVERIRSLKRHEQSQTPIRTFNDGIYGILPDTPNKETVEFIDSIKGMAKADLIDLEARVKSISVEKIPPHPQTFIRNALENRHLSKSVRESQSQSRKPKHKNVDFSHARSQIEEDFDKSFGVYLSVEELSAAKSIAASIGHTLTTLSDNRGLQTDIVAINHSLADQIDQLNGIVSESPIFRNQLST